MAIDVSKFSHGVRCRRIEKLRTSVDGDVLYYKPGSVKSPRVYDRSQVLLEDDTYYYVSPVKVVGSKAAPIKAADTTWASGSAFTAALAKDVGADGRAIPKRTVMDSIASDDFDKVLSVCTDMGRYDIAWRLVVSHLDLPLQMPVSYVQWEKFPHKSAMILMTSEHTAVAPAGMVAHVVDRWWALNGGYHGSFMYNIGAREYSQFMNSIRNPYKVAGVIPGNILLGRQYHAAYQMPPNAKKPSDGRKSWVYNGILYLADVDGVVLPYWYTSSRGARPEKVAWDADVRRALANELGLPISLARALEAHVESKPIGG